MKRFLSRFRTDERGATGSGVFNTAMDAIRSAMGG
jgi:hypothetical protein